jgi:hypothetical protein
VNAEHFSLDSAIIGEKNEGETFGAGAERYPRAGQITPARRAAGLSGEAVQRAKKNALARANPADCEAGFRGEAKAASCQKTRAKKTAPKNSSKI